ncbi:sensor histidine kinase [Lederbergia lenta]|uniref:Integral membrane sensor signal transduction histidine kinase n=1 Tax=Lederbergia lenta TaxID=1467 RepID=A0A2X4WUI3_LEDLE|nr:histidine kinase [Lederbergia lenta]MEC2322972.1 histidine kinase [Lederbergia lenta]SQI62132.1 integral membrane sensor signal transduction histidine kinase [Lederbergia lenta]
MKNMLFFSRWNLQWKFLFLFLLLVLLPMLAFSIFIYNQANKAVQVQAVNNVKSHLEKMNQNLLTALQDIEDISAYMIYSEDIRSFLQSSNPVDSNLYSKRINGFAVFHLTSKPYLNSISLQNFSGSQMDIGTNLGENDESKWRNKAEMLKGKIFWSDAYSIKDQWGRENKVITLYRVINDLNDFTSALGMVAIRLDAEKLYRKMEPDFQNIEEIYVLNRNGDVILHSNPKLIGHPYPKDSIATAIQKGKGSSVSLDFKENKVNYTAVAGPIEGTNMVVLGIVNKENVAQGISSIQESILIMMVVLTTLGLLALLGFYQFNIKRIKILANQTKQVEKGDFTAKVSVKSGDEIGLLGLRFNKMVERLKHLVENEYQMEIRNRESELKLLQSQINPHFLYNTLDMIRWTARLESAGETSKLIEQLSKMFRISLNRGKPWITLKDELTYNQIYLEFQKRRLGDKLKFTIYCDYRVLESFVLKQMIQPLIENSLQHGFENKRIVRHIYIRSYLEHDMLIIDVIDNGEGFNTNHFNDAIKTGFALQNIHSRLQTAFGKSANITIKQINSPGAWIRITHPYTESLLENDMEVKGVK